MTASPGDGEQAAREGYYPDPSIPGYVRFWNGLNWVPGTSRPAVPADETGPVFLDETGVSEALREPEPGPPPAGGAGPRDEPVVWQADPLHQSGFGGPRDHRISWGSEPAAAARPAGISLARTPVPAQMSGSAAAEGVGILSARSPAAAAAAAAAAQAPAPAPAPLWPAAPGSVGSQARPVERTERAAPPERAAQAQAPATASAEAPAPARPGPAAEPPAQRPAAAAPPAPATPAAPRRATERAVFERMAERAVRPAGLVRRSVARLLDSLVYAAVATGTALPLVPGATAHVQAKVDAARVSGRTTTVWLLDGTITGLLGLVLGAVLLFGVLYEALPTARWGRTPGKKLLGVRVLATATLRPPGFGAALRRWLVYALLGLPGALWALADRPRRRTLHDRSARTYVAR
ncbi:RDD family protein [Streptomyces sp. NBC_00096]|uniref:RDD family protein n=1 Tax=Streptomyces sp. NBC_00096 TaxID=2975650 RepID=UPI003253B535